MIQSVCEEERPRPGTETATLGPSLRAGSPMISSDLGRWPGRGLPNWHGPAPAAGQRPFGGPSIDGAALVRVGGAPSASSLRPLSHRCTPPGSCPLFLQPPVDGAGGDAQQLGAQALVAAGVGQRGVDDPALDLFQRRARRRRSATCRRRAALPPLRTSGGRSSSSMAAPARQHHRALDGVLQLAHVARPVVAGQRLGGGAREARQVPAVALAVELQEVLGQQRARRRADRAAAGCGTAMTFSR